MKDLKDIGTELTEEELQLVNGGTDWKTRVRKRCYEKGGTLDPATFKCSK